MWAPIIVGSVLVILFARRSWFHDFPIVDVRLLRSTGFSASAATVMLVGAALFGGMLLLPLYYQIDRGLSPLDAGLLLAPQGIGAAVAMHWSGRLTDRIGGGPVVVAGLLTLIVGTLPFTQVTGSTSYALLAFSLVVRGVGLGFTMMPAMASAYALLETSQVPRATPMLNVVQRIGGSIGTAVLAVVLQRQLADAVPAAVGAGARRRRGGGADAAAGRARAALRPDRRAFGQTYWWSVALVAVAIVPALVMWREQRRTRARAEFGPASADAVERDRQASAAPGAARARRRRLGVHRFTRTVIFIPGACSAHSMPVGAGRVKRCVKLPRLRVRVAKRSRPGAHADAVRLARAPVPGDRVAPRAIRTVGRWTSRTNALSTM